MATIGIIGGSGPEGRGLGLRFAMAGHSVFLGSRDRARGQAAADELLQIVPNKTLSVAGGINKEAAVAADWIVISVPFQGLREIMQELSSEMENKIVISVVAPLVFENRIPHKILVEEGSAAELIASLLPKSRIVSAFHHVSAHDLLVPQHVVEGDIIICSDDDGAKRQVSELVNQVKWLKAIDGGTLRNSSYIEQLTVLLLRINLLHKARAMIKLIGL